jgi:ATP-binding cassette subfamily B protein
MMAIGWVTNLIQRGKASLNRIDKIMQTHPDIDDIPGARPINNIKGSIIFDNVSFSYPSDPNESGKKFVLDGINIQLDHGNILGIVGPPGSGKTTLLSLIPRIFDTSQGRILIDGIDIRNMQLRNLRSQIALVSQEPFLFADTIWKNIAFSNQETNDFELIRATEEACVHDTVKSFPDGYETIVGEKGVVLSGGQKQRIALARALLQEPTILILDDPVSQVDMETGNTIINTIRSKADRSTIIIVSHRLPAVRFADQIITLSKGRIVESGTHDELMANDEYYAKTFRLQEIEEQYAH